jgi:hypothetical protein
MMKQARSCRQDAEMQEELATGPLPCRSRRYGEVFNGRQSPFCAVPKWSTGDTEMLQDLVMAAVNDILTFGKWFPMKWPATGGMKISLANQV